MKPTSTCQSSVLSTASALALMLIAASAAVAGAQTIALDFTPGGHQEIDASNITAGWDFSLTSDVLVTDLGVWDGNNAQVFGPPDGLAEAHLITIWTSTGTLLTSGSVSSGTGGTLVDGFRYVSITPTLLAAGNYMIGAYYPTNVDAFASNATTITTAPEVTYGQTRFIPGNGFPVVAAGASNGYFGPNFRFTAPAVRAPETGSNLALLALSLVALVGYSVIRRRLSS